MPRLGSFPFVSDRRQLRSRRTAAKPITPKRIPPRITASCARVATQGVILDPQYQAEVAKYKLAIARDAEWKIQSKSKELDFSYKAQGIRGQLTGHGFSTC